MCITQSIDVKAGVHGQEMCHVHVFRSTEVGTEQRNAPDARAPRIIRRVEGINNGLQICSVGHGACIVQDEVDSPVCGNNTAGARFDSAWHAVAVPHTERVDEHVHVAVKERSHEQYGGNGCWRHSWRCRW